MEKFYIVTTASLRILLGIFFIYVTLRFVTGIFLVLTHGESEERKAKAYGTVKEGLLGIFIITIGTFFVSPLVTLFMRITSL